MTNTLGTTITTGGAQPVLSYGNSVSGFMGIVSVQPIPTLTYTVTLVGYSNLYATLFSVGLGGYSCPTGSGAIIYTIPNTVFPSGASLVPGLGMGVFISTNNNSTNNEEIQISLTVQ
jgi:hypothetical protein